MRPRVLESDSAIVERIMRRSVAVPAVPNQAAVAALALRELGWGDGARMTRTAFVVSGLGLAGGHHPPAAQLVWTAVSSGQALRQAHRALQCGTVDLAVVVSLREPAGFYLTVVVLRRAAEAVAEADQVLGLVGPTSPRGGYRGHPVESLVDLLAGLDRQHHPDPSGLGRATGTAPAEGGGGPRAGWVRDGGAGLYLYPANSAAPVRPAVVPALEPAATRLLLWSGRDEDDERRVRRNLRGWLATMAPGDYPALATVVPRGRPPGAVRAAVVASAPVAADAVAAAPRARPRHRPVVLVFPGHGVHRAGLAPGLYRREQVFTAAVDAALHLLGADGERIRDGWLGADPLLADARLARPALFAVDYALGRLVLSWGVRPAALLGHDVGELVAATLAGVFSLPDAARLVCEQLHQATTGKLLVAAGAAPPGHWPANPAGLGVEHVVADFELRPPARPVYSAYSGGVVGAADATDPHYWAGLQASTDGAGRALDQLLTHGGAALLVEAGCGRTLTATASRHRAVTTGVSDAVSLLPGQPGDPDTDLHSVLTVVARLWTEGHDLDPDAVARLWAPYHADAVGWWPNLKRIV